MGMTIGLSDVGQSPAGDFLIVYNTLQVSEYAMLG